MSAYSDAVKAATRGRWREILRGMGVASEALRDRHGPCPGCGGTDRFRFDDMAGRGSYFCSQGGAGDRAGDGFDLVQHVFGVGFVDAVEMVGRAVGLPATIIQSRIIAPLSRRVTLPLDPAAVPDWRSEQREIEKLLAQGKRPAVGGAVRCYLARRGLSAVLDDLPPEMREVQAAEYWEADSFAGCHPAMVLPVRNVAGEIVSAHRTFLDFNGNKAAVGSPKKLMRKCAASITGAAVQLYPCDKRLAVAEGIESALAVRVQTGWPVWAAISAGGLKSLQIPAGVVEVQIHADHDPVGIEAAQALRDRLIGECCAVTLIVPEREGFDPCDVLLGANHA